VRPAAGGVRSPTLDTARPDEAGAVFFCAIGASLWLNRGKKMNRMTPNKILWIYIVLLFLGGLVGYLKAGSKISLMMAAVFSAVLSLCASGVLFQARVADLFADILLAVLLVFFAVRLTKTKKFMPNGLMSALSLAALVMRHLRF
jgi:uncharacterized membrane protein (UPF0136 family)